MLDDLNGSFLRVEDVVEDLAAPIGNVLDRLGAVRAPRPERRIIEDQGVLDGLGEVEEDGCAVVEGVRVAGGVEGERAWIPADVRVVDNRHLVMHRVVKLIDCTARAAGHKERHQGRYPDRE